MQKSAILLMASCALLTSCNAKNENEQAAQSGTNEEAGAPSAAAVAPAASVYPVLKAGQKEFVIPASDAKLRIQRLVFPAGLTIRLDPAIKSVDWSVDSWEIGQNTTIELSASQSKPVKPPKASPLGQAGVCKNGSGGKQGTQGTTGNVGPSLTIRDLHELKNDGSLWIRGDGGPGGDGGDGQDGQPGGPGLKGPWFKCPAGKTGPGGPGGQPGPGGPVVDVKIIFAGTPTGAVSIGTAPKCGRSTRPSGATGATGVIAVYGGEGCPGQAGQPGKP